MAALIFRNHRIFGNFNVSSENFPTFAVGKDKGFEFYRKIFELGPLIYRYHDAPEPVPFVGNWLTLVFS